MAEPSTGGGIPKDAIVVPHAFGVLTQDDILQGINRLVELTEAQIPVGRTVELNFPASDPVTTAPRRIDLKPHWFSIEAINDGGTTLVLYVNVLDNNGIRITPEDRSIHFDFDIGIISVVYLQSELDIGQARLIGTY